MTIPCADAARGARLEPGHDLPRLDATQVRNLVPLPRPLHREALRPLHMIHELCPSLSLSLSVVGRGSLCIATNRFQHLSSHSLVGVF